ncbi:hypothetical protein [Kitasatospora viridis]|uniref:Uncharacterized protein n=1 Tax=Kitasatospora viridis TaxID=281105 RepID=A0A561UKJ4_9ACTN|nr:hypothetical protein [Kitasatospora viridis]TWF99891.1 hypothetical protein FHX73_113751 [Kitasatospora viridis]
MSGRLEQLCAEQRAVARRARIAFEAELARAGVRLPSLGLDDPGDGYRGEIQVELGRARPDVLDQITELLREALDAREQRRPDDEPAPDAEAAALVSRVWTLATDPEGWERTGRFMPCRCVLGRAGGCVVAACVAAAELPPLGTELTGPLGRGLLLAARREVDASGVVRRTTLAWHRPRRGRTGSYSWALECAAEQVVRPARRGWIFPPPAQLRLLYDQLGNSSLVGDALGISSSAVREHMQRVGLARRRRPGA